MIAFSAACLFLTKRRSCLDDKTIYDLCFLCQYFQRKSNNAKSYALSSYCILSNKPPGSFEIKETILFFLPPNKPHPIHTFELFHCFSASFIEMK